MTPLTTDAAVAAWLDAPAPDGVDRLIARASELIHSIVLTAYDVDDVDTAAVLSDATCAQIEAWLTVGEEASIAGYEGTQSVAGLSSGQPARVSPRALIILRVAGLLQPTGW